MPPTPRPDSCRNPLLGILSYCLLCVLLIVSSACTTPPATPAAEPPPLPLAAPEPEALPVLSIVALEAKAVDQHRSSLTVTARVENPRRAALVLSGTTLRYGLLLETGSHDLGTLQPEGDIQVAAFSASTLELHFELDTRILDHGVPGFKDLGIATVQASLAATARVPPDESGQPAGGLVELLARTEAQVPLIREPDLRILAINLVKHELINVILEVVIEISNPNAFPLEFDQLAYDFYGEGKRWSRGRERKALLIPARGGAGEAGKGSANGTATTRIPVMLNFTEMDRRVFDLVEKLQVVSYRLAGTATVHTGLDFLPQFTMAFDRAGAVKVERTLSRR
jgi:LEA14-like dessication related protein